LHLAKFSDVFSLNHLHLFSHIPGWRFGKASPPLCQTSPFHWNEINEKFYINPPNIANATGLVKLDAPLNPASPALPNLAPCEVQRCIFIKSPSSIQSYTALEVWQSLPTALPNLAPGELQYHFFIELPS